MPQDRGEHEHSTGPNGPADNMNHIRDGREDPIAFGHGVTVEQVRSHNGYGSSDRPAGVERGRPCSVAMMNVGLDGTGLTEIRDVGLNRCRLAGTDARPNKAPDRQDRVADLYRQRRLEPRSRSHRHTANQAKPYGHAERRSHHTRQPRHQRQGQPVAPGLEDDLGVHLDQPTDDNKQASAPHPMQNKANVALV